eukprot:TRINITY_DN24791_c0_g1_i2.p1 TRINITY_DN24791_c0_g1~~TRINITY_DN24791_c0_g1_i2.p1  ORF type:complete len:363 (+),score=119.03 TRINITY_DN24791_c0_g1_i2:963-2051(+)
MDARLAREEEQRARDVERLTAALGDSQQLLRIERRRSDALYSLLRAVSTEDLSWQLVAEAEGVGGVGAAILDYASAAEDAEVRRRGDVEEQERLERGMLASAMDTCCAPETAAAYMGLDVSDGMTLRSRGRVSRRVGGCGQHGWQAPQLVRVHDVADGGPAAAAGIEPGDYVVRLGDVDVRAMADFRRAARGIAPGAVVPIFIRRDGADGTRRAFLQTLPAGDASFLPGSRRKVSQSFTVMLPGDQSLHHSRVDAARREREERDRRRADQLREQRRARELAQARAAVPLRGPSPPPQLSPRVRPAADAAVPPTDAAVQLTATRQPTTPTRTPRPTTPRSGCRALRPTTRRMRPKSPRDGFCA